MYLLIYMCRCHLKQLVYCTMLQVVSVCPSIKSVSCIMKQPWEYAVSPPCKDSLLLTECDGIISSYVKMKLLPQQDDQYNFMLRMIWIVIYAFPLGSCISDCFLKAADLWFVDLFPYLHCTYIHHNLIRLPYISHCRKQF